MSYEVLSQSARINSRLKTQNCTMRGVLSYEVLSQGCVKVER